MGWMAQCRGVPRVSLKPPGCGSVLNMFLIYLDFRYTGWAVGVFVMAKMLWPVFFFPILLSLNVLQNGNTIPIIQGDMHTFSSWISHWCIVVGASAEGWGPDVPYYSSCGCRNYLDINRETALWQHNVVLGIYCNIQLRGPQLG